MYYYFNINGGNMKKVLIVKKPWGTFKRYTLNELVTVKILTVNSGQCLSKQSHRMRSELWVPLDEGAEMEIGDRKIYPKKEDEVWIPQGVAHRLSSKDNKVRVLEISFGNFDEEDVIRYEDKYGRVNK
jgi:mannose-1-phosphate guanylyltransferase/mannose-6-phosphate isomerase